MSEKDLAYYQANPDDLADMSVEQLEALASGAEPANKGDTSSDATPGAATEDATGKAETEAAATEQPKADDPVEPKDDEAEGILSKDGKHVMPFSVLQGTRAEKARLEQVVREQREELDRLKASPQQSTQQAREPQGEQSAQVLSEDELSAVEVEFPALGKILRAQQRSIYDMSAQLAEERQAQQQDRASKAANTIQAAIDSIPKMAHLQATDPEGFAKAIEIDDSMRGRKAWANKPFAERFAAVVETYERENGEIRLPTSSQPKTPAPAAVPKPSQPAAAPVRRGPASLSDLPGGAPAPVDEMARIEQATSVELTARFEDMTPDQLSDWIARNGG